MLFVHRVDTEILHDPMGTLYLRNYGAKEC